MVFKHAYLNTLLFLHPTFMLSVVKIPLRGEAEGHALKSHGNYIVDCEKNMEMCFRISVGILNNGVSDYCCSVSLPLGAVGWSVVCDCGISWLYSLVF